MMQDLSHNTENSICENTFFWIHNWKQQRNHRYTHCEVLFQFLLLMTPKFKLNYSKLRIYFQCFNTLGLLLKTKQKTQPMPLCVDWSQKGHKPRSQEGKSCEKFYLGAPATLSLALCFSLYTAVLEGRFKK